LIERTFFRHVQYDELLYAKMTRLI